MKTTLVLVTLAIALSVATGEEEPDLKAFKAAMKSRDAAARLAGVAEVAKTRHEEVAEALAKHLGDKDPRVRAAVARALGAQGDRKYVKQLLGRLKRWEKDDNRSVIGCLEGLALLPDSSAVKDLTGIIRKTLADTRFHDRRVAVSAVAALGKIREKQVVDQLTDLLDLTRPLGPAKGYANEELRIFRTSLRTAIHTTLTEMTDQYVKVTDVWQRWWKRAGAEFEFRTGKSDPNAAMTYEDDPYGFVLEKPAETWTFTRMDYEHVIIKLIHPIRPRSAVTDVEVLLEAYSTTEYFTRTPALAAAWMDEWAATQGFRKGADGRPRFRVAPETVDAEIAGQKGKLWRASGMRPQGKDVVLRKYLFLREGLLWTLTVETAVDLAEEVQSELDRALASLRFIE